LEPGQFIFYWLFIQEKIADPKPVFK